jgi:hypothetical protein
MGVGTLGVSTTSLPFLVTLDLHGAAIAGATLLSCLVAVCIPLGVLILPFGPEFVTRANRARERRERWLDRLSFVIQLRWGWSICGIGMICAALGLFDENKGAAATPYALTALAIGAIVIVVTAGCATRDVRRTISFLLAVAVLYCLSIWIMRRLHSPVDRIWFYLSPSALPALAMTIAASAFAREGDNVTVATLRALERLAASIAFYCSGAVVALLVLGSVAGSLLMIAGAVAGAIMLPAFMTLLFDLFPPRASLDAYRIR